MSIRFIALQTDVVRKLQNGNPDAYGNHPEKNVSDGCGVPCRHCLRNVKAGDEYLIVAHQPFSTSQPYAETGPIFLHAAPCERAGGEKTPEILDSSHYIVRGYGEDERIVYGTGSVVETDSIAEYSEKLFQRTDISFLHLRSASNNCFHCRIERAE